MSDAPRERAVENGQVVYTSASAINRFIDCQRSWWFRYVAGLPDPAGPSAERGKEAHGRLEHFLKTGEDVLADSERQGMAYIPAPNSSLLVEHRLEEDGHLTLADIPMKGGIDLVQFGGPTFGTITDWKFHDSPFWKAPLPGELKSLQTAYGRQMLAYAEWLRRAYLTFASPKAMLTLRHVHFQFDCKRPTAAVSTKVPLAFVKESWDTLSDSYSSRLKAAAAAKSPTDVEPNLNHCRKYRKPCVYLDKCQEGRRAPVKTSALFARKEPTQMASMLEQMKLLTQAPPPVLEAPAAPPAAESVPEMATTEAVATIQGSRGGLEDATPKRRGRPPGSKNKPKEAEPENVSVTHAAGRGGSNDQNVLRESGSGATMAAGSSPGSAPPALSREMMEVTDRNRVLAGKPQMFEAYIGKVTAAAPEPALAPVEPQPEPVTVSSPVPDAVTLYLDCAPGSPTSNLFGYADSLAKALLDEAQDDSTDIRLSEHHSLKFGKWRAALSVAASRHPPEPGEYVYWGGDELVDAVVAGLLRVLPPENVIRGRR